jgi:hypothetical protein
MHTYIHTYIPIYTHTQAHIPTTTYSYTNIHRWNASMFLYECFHVEEGKVGGVRKYYDKEETRASERGSNRD